MLAKVAGESTLIQGNTKLVRISCMLYHVFIHCQLGRESDLAIMGISNHVFITCACGNTDYLKRVYLVEDCDSLLP